MRAKLGWILGGSFGVCLVGSVSAILIGEHLSNQRRLAAHAEARKAGFPLTVEELRAMGPPPHENAGLVYERLAKELEAQAKYTKRLEPTAKFSAAEIEEGWAKVEPILKTYEPEIARFPKSALPHKIADDGNVLMPLFFNVKDATKQYSFLVSRRFKRGDSAGALRALETQYQIAQHLNQEPSMIGLLVTVACTAIADASASQLAAARPRDGAWQDAIQAIVEKKRQPIHVENFNLTEAYFVVWAMKSVAHGESDTLFGSDGDIPLSFRIAIRTPAVRNEAEARMLLAHVEIGKIVRQRDLSLEQKNEGIEKVMAPLAEPRDLAGSITSVLGPVFSSALGSVIRSERSRLALLAFLEVQRADAAGRPPILSKTYLGHPFHVDRKGGALRVIDLGTDQKFNPALVYDQSGDVGFVRNVAGEGAPYRPNKP